MNSYLLFIFSDFRDREEQVKLIANCITPLVISPRLKFTYCDSSMILNFATDFDHNELKEIVLSAIGPLCNQYYLISHSDKMSVNMTKDLYEHLFNLDVETKDVNMDIRDEMPNKKGIGGNFLDFEKEILLPLQEFSGPIIGVFKSPINDEPKKDKTIMESIQEILDKIGETGYESLTNEEKDFLKTNSKKG